MYKPNGEEPMTQREEQQHRKALAESRQKKHAGAGGHSTFSTLHAAFIQGQASHRETVGASFEPLR